MAEWTGRNAAGEIVTVRFAPIYAGQTHPDPNDESNPIHSGNATGAIHEFSPGYRGANGGTGTGGVPGFPDPATGGWVEDWTGVESMYGGAGARGVSHGYLTSGTGTLAGGTAPVSGRQDDLTIPPAAQANPRHPWWSEPAAGPYVGDDPYSFTNFEVYDPETGQHTGPTGSAFLPHGQAIENWEKKIVGGGDALELGSHTALMNETLLGVGINPVDFHAGNVSEDMLLAASGQAETAVKEQEVTIIAEPDPEAIPYFDEPEGETALEWALKHFPWAKNLNLGAMIKSAVEEDTDTDVLIAQVRDTPNYRATFPGMTDDVGRMRFLNEQAYVDQVGEYRNVLQDAGSIGGRQIFDATKENPVDYATLMERGISTAELQSRLDTYRDLTNNSWHVRAAFSTYANMEVGVDQLYQTVVDPEASATLAGQYNQNVLDADFDYSSWVANATQAALDATMETLQDLRTQGIVDEGILARINSLTGEGEAQALVEALYLGEPDDGDSLLELDELIEAFQFALIGGAAMEQGLTAPSKERVGTFRQAGIDRAKALRGYGTFVNQGSMIRSMLGRTNVQGEGVGRFGQGEFEDAIFLSQAPEMDLLTRARQGELARSRAPGGFATTAKGSRLAQPARAARQ
ncbi:MAG: hypothetical protein CL489_03320 [Acidobacteria bacterium]|nr:hypothetical protein [Acidobacteriota bacterium]